MINIRSRMILRALRLLGGNRWTLISVSSISSTKKRDEENMRVATQIDSNEKRDAEIRNHLRFCESSDGRTDR